MRQCYLGLDGAPAGWMVVAFGPDFEFSHHLVAELSAGAEVLASATLALIDMPIGLAQAQPLERHCDTAARRYLGRPRSSSVFPVPCRAALAGKDYPSASATNHQQTGRKLSKQTWNIMPRIAEVDSFLRANPHQALRESHPEVCFAGLNGGSAMQHNKKTPAGFAERMGLLRQHLPTVRRCFNTVRNGHAKRQLADDDIVDALVLALVAKLGCEHGALSTLPDQPGTDSCGLPMEIAFMPIAR